LESQFIPEGRSLFLFGPDNKFRLFLHRLTNNIYFDGVIVFFIAVSSIMLALDNPLNDPNGTMSDVLKYSDLIFTIIFGCEFILRVIVHGAIFNGEKSYLRTLGNVIDFLIVALSVLSISLSNVEGL
jgi:hypothetical protein